MGEELIGIIAVSGLFGWIPIMVYMKHKIHLEQIRLQGKTSAETLQTLEDLRSEVRQLRDTSTKFDVAFDAALDRMEERVNRLEGRVATVAQESETLRVGVGGR